MPESDDYVMLDQDVESKNSNQLEAKEATNGNRKPLKFGKDGHKEKADGWLFL